MYLVLTVQTLQTSYRTHPRGRYREGPVSYMPTLYGMVVLYGDGTQRKQAMLSARLSVRVQLVQAALVTY